jgi:hypothetical protein
MGEVEAEGSRDMVRFQVGRDRPRTRARGCTVVYPKAGTEVGASGEMGAGMKVCTRAEIKVRRKTEMTAVGMLTERGETRER